MSCVRCVVSPVQGRSEYCWSCNRTLDAMIERAMDGDVTDTELMGILGLGRDALHARRGRIKKRLLIETETGTLQEPA